MIRVENLDFIKGVAILAVIVHHAICMWMPSLSLLIPFVLGHAVPLFLLTTIVLTFQKYERNGRANINYTRLSRKILFPFVIAQLVILPMALLTTGSSITNFIQCFGLGMGTYYILIYVQILLLAWPVFSLLKKNIWLGVLAILCVHIGCDVLFRFCGLPEWAYRLLCTRYLFLFALGYIFVSNKLNSKMLMIVIMGGGSASINRFRSCGL